MAHDGDACIEDGAYRLLYLHTPFELERIATAFLHDADSVLHALRGVDLIGAERHVADDECPSDASCHAAGVVNHLVERDGQSRYVAGHHVAGAVAHKNDVDASLVHQLSQRIVVGSEHGYLLPLLLHFNQTMSRHLSRIAY